ncbi:hypothetical protein PV10_01673 [Exophiala mesophila]|uniref:Major facilitator superfamily (MFS) profile domain-containing protein n=1 Tax=Exophiala mesophila TaxID=212818 RepID=A0A0D2AGF1_EXOME|nr:uncharacterized protein PV10_01673 [Exophiala mesophila]KIV97978.1 hypothetical protein PV10_01673 [Exophiala mesophila]
MAVDQKYTNDGAEHLSTTDLKANVALNDFHEAAEHGRTATDNYGNVTVTFDADAEKRLRHKIDRYIAPNAMIIYLLCFLDRINIGNARIANLEADLDMHGLDYNRLLAIFFVAYIVFEIPANMLCKVVGPGWFMPAAVVLFGVLTLATGYVNSLGAAYAVRFLLGIAEAGVLPGLSYYLSRWYRRSELTFRISLYMVMSPLAGGLGGLLASAILTMDNFAGLREWRMIFAVEGIITIGVGVITFFTMTDRPETARWLSQDEKDLAISRIKSERISTTELVDKLNRRKIWMGIISPVSLVGFFTFLFAGVTVQGISIFLPTIIRTIYPGTSVVHQQLRTVPPYAVGCAFALGLPYLSYRINRRQVFFLFSGPVLIIAYAMFLGTDTSQPQVRYGATFLIALGSFPLGTFNNAQPAANSVSDTARNAALGFVNFGGHLGGLISTWSYLPFDAPNFPIGNGLNVGTSSGILLLSIGLIAFMKWDNKRRDARDVDAELAGKSQGEIQDLEWRHPGFRWRP